MVGSVALMMIDSMCHGPRGLTRHHSSGQLLHFTPLSPQPGGGATCAACVPVMNPGRLVKRSLTVT